MHNSWIVDERNYFSRLDKFLRHELKHVPLSAIYKFIRTGKVFINKKRIRNASAKLEIGDIVEIVGEDLTKYSRDYTELKPVSMKLDIIFEDARLLVINKPTGLSVHPGKNVSRPSLIEGLMYYAQKNDFEAFLVHRLDKETSGVLIVAKDRNTARVLGELISSRFVVKKYLALVFGKIHVPRRIEEPIDGQEALTKVVPLKQFHWNVNGYEHTLTLLDVEIETGRKHQIRKHLSKIGTPIVCDNEYGNFQLNRLFSKHFGLKRQFLHCKLLGFELDGKRYEFEAPLPGDLSTVLEILTSGRGLR